MQDRVSQYPGRVKLTPVSGQENVYDMEWADQPVVEGTPLNKETLLSAETEATFGLGTDKTVDEILRSCTRVEIGNYSGTGTYGSENKNSLSFSFYPSMIFIQQTSIGNKDGTAMPIVPFMQTAQVLVDGTTNNYISLNSSFNDDDYTGNSGVTVQWYSSRNAQIQLNEDGSSYRYIAVKR